MRTITVGLALLAVSSSGLVPASATTQYVPIEGVITITDDGLGGPRAWWTYDPLLDCGFSTDGPAGIASIATVTCYTSQNPLGIVFSCPRMVVSRTTATVVGARAKCDDNTLDLGVGTTGAAEADLGLATILVRCEAYMNDGVLVPPYTVTCVEPAVPGVEVSLWSSQVE